MELSYQFLHLYVNHAFQFLCPTVLYFPFGYLTPFCLNKSIRVDIFYSGEVVILGYFCVCHLFGTCGF